MFNLLLIDVAACVALIMVAALVMVLRWNRRGRPLPMVFRKLRRRSARAGERRAPRPAAVVPGFSEGGRQPGALAAVPPARQHALRTGQRGQPASVAQPAYPAPGGHPAPARQPAPGGHPAPARQPQQPRYTAPAGPRPPARPPPPAGQPTPARQPPRGGQPAAAGQPELARQPPQAAPRTTVTEGTQPGPARHEPAAAPDEQPDIAARSSERIGSYYDEADRAMSDYLTQMGWPDEPATHGPQ
jgi:hypothetical protein